MGPLAGRDGRAGNWAEPHFALPAMAEQRRGKAELGSFKIEEDDNPDRAAVDWIREQFDQEVARVKGKGQMVIPVPVKNCSVVKEGKAYINRVECATAFDFSKVKQILLSEPVACPDKDGAPPRHTPPRHLPRRPGRRVPVLQCRTCHTKAHPAAVAVRVRGEPEERPQALDFRQHQDAARSAQNWQLCQRVGHPRWPSAGGGLGTREPQPTPHPPAPLSCHPRPRRRSPRPSRPPRLPPLSAAAVGEARSGVCRAEGRRAPARPCRPPPPPPSSCGRLQPVLLRP